MFEKSKTPSFYPEAAISCVENPRNTQVFLAVFSLKLTASGQKTVISSIFKQALRREKQWKEKSSNQWVSATW
ncbi:hypothetical protein [Acutalibacter caecimuris]|uniref:hypothetical protein n=1 Tax=Acutalibacter caecimuris TaxID=3093657 RepID=UPI002AC8AA08|nr:hypothetical protein [Acutalibacter sp. M00118]